jgi:flagellar motor switch protein FliG
MQPELEQEIQKIGVEIERLKQEDPKKLQAFLYELQDKLKNLNAVLDDIEGTSAKGTAAS